MAGRIAVIVEGAKQEKKYFKSMEKVFFACKKLDIFVLSGGENIYALWQQMRLDKFETDIIEVLREKSRSASTKLKGISRGDFQEVYLFYDYDPQQDNASNTNVILKSMLEVFNNETENGKLYISYPMSEALRDIRQDSCVPYTCCMYPLDCVKSYKQRTGNKNEYVHVGSYMDLEWYMLLSIYISRLTCLYGVSRVADIFLNEKELNNPLKVFEEEQKRLKATGKIFILSAFPEFLVDYFPVKKIMEIATRDVKPCTSPSLIMS